MKLPALPCLFIDAIIIPLSRNGAVADPDLELRGGGRGGGLDLLAMAAIFPSVISSFFTQNKGGGGGPLP